MPAAASPRVRIAAGLFLAAAAAALCVALIFYLKDHDYMRDDYPYTRNSYDWAGFEQFHPVPPGQLIRLPSGAAVAFPPVQHAFRDSDLDGPRRELLASRASAVKDACRKTWNAYSRHALPHDELYPLTLGRTDPLGGWGATMVDGLDTLWIMGMKKEFYSALRHVVDIDWADESYLALNLFETTIRYLGGLISAHDLTGIPVLLHKAIDLADMLLVAFDTPNRMPPFWLTYDDARAGTQLAGANQGSASASSLCLEFTRLAQLSGEAKYFDAVHRVTLFLSEAQNSTLLPGMWPNELDFYGLTVGGTHFTMGAGADSLYEYLLKMHVLLAGTAPIYGDMYLTASETARANLLFRPMIPPASDTGPDDGDDTLLLLLLLGSADVTYQGERPDVIPELQHLGCFAGAMFALGGKILDLDSHVETGERLARGCAWAYTISPHGIMPEISGLAPCPTANPGDECAFNRTRWQDYDGGSTLDGPFTEVVDATYLLRPEVIESLFYMYRITGDPSYQEVAWDMWTAIANATETEHAFAAVKDVFVAEDERVELMDEMESFWVSETLKYFYLIFSPPGLLSLDEWVFNTEAHPFKRGSL